MFNSSWDVSRGGDKIGGWLRPVIACGVSKVVTEDRRCWEEVKVCKNLVLLDFIIAFRGGEQQ